MCGSPGAGKTTVAAAAARHLGLPVLTRDEIKAGLALSSARVTADGTVEYHPDAHIAGGPLAQRAEEVMNRTARLLASAGVSFVVESSVLSGHLVDALHEAGARVLAVHVVAAPEVIGARLRARAARGRPVDAQLAAQFARGAMDPSIFAAPDGADAVADLDTSAGGGPPVELIEAAVGRLMDQAGGNG